MSCSHISEGVRGFRVLFKGLIQDLLDDSGSMLYPLDCFKYLSYTNYLEHKKERQEAEANNDDDEAGSGRPHSAPFRRLKGGSSSD